MKKAFIILGLVFCAILIVVGAPPSQPTTDWTPLLDSQLSQWEMFVGVPDPSVSVPGYTHAADPKEDQPLGLNHDPMHIYSIRSMDGEPVLHITGEVFGGLTSLKTYDDFHLRVQFRWGTAKHAPRQDKPRDNGILYRCFGPHGSVTHAWKHCLECQVQEKDIGDFFSLGGQAEVPCKEYAAPRAAKAVWRYTPGEPLRLFQGRCAHGVDYHELPNGEWNTIEIMAVGSRSLHILNGKVVNVLQNARRGGDNQKQPLVSGQIQIQSEGAEAEYRRIEIRPLPSFPAEYEALFNAAKSVTPPVNTNL